MSGAINYGLPIDPALQHEEFEYPYVDLGFPNYQVPGPTRGQGAPSQSFGPFNPSAISSTSKVMMGLGATVIFTPAGSGRVRITWSGTVSGSTAGTNNVVNFSACHGVGAAPAYGAPITGDDLDQTARNTNGGSTSVPTTYAPFCLDTVLTLAIGTGYWFDMAIAMGTGMTSAAVGQLNATLQELSQ